MTTDVVSAAMIPSRLAWRSLIWMVPLTILWVVLIYWEPIIQTGGVPTSAHQLAAHGLIAAPLLLLSKRVGQLLDAIPVTWLVALQLYRVFGSWALAAWLRGELPGVFALPAGTGDVLTGLFAVPAAIAVATGTAQGRRAAIAWNIFGLADFAVAITLGLITSPGRFQLIVPDVSSIGAGAYPGVLTPAFVVPS